MPQDAHIEHRNDVIEVVLREDGDIGYGVVYFHQMGEKPGEITNRIEAVLTVENLERFRGNWRRAIKVIGLSQFYNLDCLEPVIIGFQHT